MMLEESLSKFRFPSDNPEGAEQVKLIIKKVYNQLKRLPENRKISRQKLMDDAVVKVYNAFTEVIEEAA